MSTIINIRADQLPEAYRNEAKKVKGAIDKAAKRAARRLQVHLRKIVDEMGITDQGTYKNSFRVADNSVYNDAPHAGIIELGARPHPVSRAGIEAIASWARRKLKVKSSEALGVAYAIAAKIAKEGQAPKYVMRDAQPHAVMFYQNELEKLLSV